MKITDIKITKKKVIIFAIIVVVVGGFLYGTFGRKSVPQYVTAKVATGKLIQTVTETGTVKSASELNLNFLNTGKVAKINVQIGDKVVAGQILAELDYGALSIKEKQAEANLAKLIYGATSQDIAVAQASVRQAEVSYNSSLSDLDKTKKSVSENIAQAKKNLDDLQMVPGHDVTNFEQAVTTAQLNLDNAKKTYQQALDNAITNALSVAQDKLISAGVALDNVNTVLTDNNNTNVLSVKDISYINITKNSLANAKILVEAANASLSAAKQYSTSDNADVVINSTLSALNQTSAALNSCYKALENSITSGSFPQAALDAYKASISGQQTAVSVAIAAAQGAQQSLSNAELAYSTNVASANNSLNQAQVSFNNAVIAAKNAYNTASLNGDQQIAAAQARADSASKSWDLAKTQLEKIKAPARQEDLTLARADLDSAKTQIENSVIRAPIDGYVTKSNYEVGEDVSPTSPVISMLSQNNLEIEILISEADIAKLQINDKTDITFDAFPSNVVFNGVVYFIEPAETVVQDVIYYKVKVKMTDQQETEKKYGDGIKVKPGMTANTVITTAEKDNVLMMPARAIVEKADGSQIVRVLVNNNVQEVPVTIGLRGDEGIVEVIPGGVKDGDLVVTSVKNQ